MPSLSSPARIYCTAILVLGVTTLNAAPKNEVPSEADQKKAEAIIRDLYKTEFGKPFAADQKALAIKLLALSSETQTDIAGRYVLLRMARNFAAMAAEPELALKAADQMASDFEVDVLGIKVEALEKAGFATVTATSAKSLTEAALQLADTAMLADRYDSAERLARIAVVGSSKARSAVLEQRARGREIEIKEIGKRYGELKDQFAKLKEQPNDPDANLEVGKFHCFLQGDWAKGLPLLALGSDLKLKMLARLDLASPTGLAEQVELGDRWFELSEQSRGAAVTQLRRRVGYWYGAAFPSLSGLEKSRIQKRITDSGIALAASTGATAVSPWSHLDTSNTKQIDDYLRINQHKQLVTKDQVSGSFEAVAIARTSKNNIRLLGPRSSFVILNWEVNTRQLRYALPDGKADLDSPVTIASAPFKPLERNKWYTIRWKLTNETMEVWFDDKMVLEHKGPHDVSKPANIRICGAFDDVVDVKSFFVRSLK